MKFQVKYDHIKIIAESQYDCDSIFDLNEKAKNKLFKAWDDGEIKLIDRRRTLGRDIIKEVMLDIKIYRK